MRTNRSTSPITASLALLPIVASLSVASLSVASLSACGGASGEPPKEPASGVDDSSAAGAPDEGSEQGQQGDDEGGAGKSGASKGLPTECATQEGDLCLPPKKFALALCDGDYRTVALWMFSAGSPWTRGYLLGKLKAVYASASGGSTGEMMPRDEEVIVVRHHGASNPGGMVVSGASGAYDVVRWDGSCATIDQGALSFDPPARPLNARLIWNRIEVDVREVLKENETVYDAYIKLKKTCKGVTMGEVSKACEKADGELSKTLAAHVRSNGGVPAPKKIPKL